MDPWTQGSEIADAEIAGGLRDRVSCTDISDDLQWEGSVTASSYGLSVRIQVTDASVLPLVREILPPYWEKTDSQVADLSYSLVASMSGSCHDQIPLYAVYSGSALLAEHPDLDVALRAMESYLHLDIADRAQDRVFVHAGVVGCQGRAILLPGRSMAGKTTLVSRLIEAGCSYYSDEFAVLDSQGLVHPYTRPLSVRGEPGVLPRRMNPEAFGGGSGLGPVPAGLILLSKYVPGATFQPRRVSPGMAVLGLMDNTVPIRRDPERSLAALAAVATYAPCWEGDRGDATEAVRFLFGVADSW